MAKKKTAKKKTTKKKGGGKKAAPKKSTAKKASKKKGAKKTAKKKARRTVMYSSGGKKLYAKRDAGGKFKDIQQYSRAHAADVRKHSASELVAEAGSTSETPV